MNTLNMEKTENLDKPFFHNIKLHNNENLLSNSPGNNTYNYYNVNMAQSNFDQYNTRPGGKVSKNCVNSADTSKFKNHFVSNIHNSLHSKENNMVLNHQFDYMSNDNQNPNFAKIQSILTNAKNNKNGQTLQTRTGNSNEKTPMPCEKLDVLREKSNNRPTNSPTSSNFCSTTPNQHNNLQSSNKQKKNPQSNILKNLINNCSSSKNNVTSTKKQLVNNLVGSNEKELASQNQNKSAPDSNNIKNNMYNTRTETPTEDLLHPRAQDDMAMMSPYESERIKNSTAENTMISLTGTPNNQRSSLPINAKKDPYMASSKTAGNNDMLQTQFQAIKESYLNELIELKLDSFANVGEQILQMLKYLKKNEDPYEIIRNYTDQVQDNVYNCISNMFTNQAVSTEINNTQKVERWGIIFLFYFNLNNKLSNDKICSNMMNLLTHVCQNFHILALMIEKNAKLHKKGLLIAKLRPILDKLQNPHMSQLNNDILLILKRNNDIVKANLKACMMYVPKASQTALQTFFKKMELWDIRVTLEKGFEAFMKFFQQEGVISINYLGMTDSSDKDENSDNEEELINDQNDDCKTNSQTVNNTTAPIRNISELTPQNNAENATDISSITQDNTNRTLMKGDINTSTPLTNYEKRRLKQETREATESNIEEPEDDDITIKQNDKTAEEEDIPTADKKQEKKKRSSTNSKQQIASFEQYLTEKQGPNLLFQPKTMENMNLLPAINPKRNYTLVLDLDETLVHFEESEEGNQFLIRPYAQNFLEEMCQYYELVIFTAGLKEVIIFN